MSQDKLVLRPRLDTGCSILTAWSLKTRFLNTARTVLKTLKIIMRHVFCLPDARARACPASALSVCPALSCPMHALCGRAEHAVGPRMRRVRAQRARRMRRSGTSARAARVGPMRVGPVRPHARRAAVRMHAYARTCMCMHMCTGMPMISQPNHNQFQNKGVKSPIDRTMCTRRPPSLL